MQKIILFYIFYPLNDPEAVCLWQRSLAERFGLKGRVIISAQGINGTLGGEMNDLKSYIKESKKYEPFKLIQYKWSDGSVDDFPKLSIKVRPELVSFGVKDRIKVTPQGIEGGGKRLTPKQLHQLMAQKKVAFFDGRNAHEAAVGKFKDATVLPIEHSRDFPTAIADPSLKPLKDQPVVTYCTGGIRCEVLSKLLIDEGFSEVYQLDGGIVKYLEAYGDEGAWEGSLYVFDRRMSLDASEKTKVLGRCSRCLEPTKNFANCANRQCNNLILLCTVCAKQGIYCRSCQPAELLK